MPKPLKIVLNVIFYLVVALLVVLAAMYTVTAINKDVNSGLPTFFGKVLQTVQSISMSPTLLEGDLIVSNKYNGQELEVGDIISFKSFDEQSKSVIIITHTIIEADNEGGLYKARGDYKDIPADQVQYVGQGDIVAVYTGTRIPKLGSAMQFVSSKYGFFFCVLIPLVLFMVWQLYQFIATLMKLKNQKMRAELDKEAEALAMKKLRELQAQGAQAESEPEAIGSEDKANE